MKKIAIICLILMSATVYSKDLYSSVQGKWTLDLKATKELPDIKKALKNKQSAMFLNMMLNANAATVWEFKKDSVIITPTIEGKKSPMPPVKIKVLKETKDTVVLETEKKDKITLTKKGVNILMEAEEEGEKGPPMVLKKSKK